MTVKSGPRMLCAALVAGSTVGCQSANPLIGKWQMTQSMMGTPITIIREFKTDGAETMTSSMPGMMASQIKYTVDGDKLSESVTSMTINGQTIAIDPSKLPPGAPKSMTETFSINGDKLTLGNTTSGVQVTQVFDRVKDQ